MKRNINLQKTTEPPLGRQFTTSELAGAIQYHEESIRRAIRAGRIRAIRCGNRWRIPPDELARIMTNGLPMLAN